MYKRQVDDTFYATVYKQTASSDGSTGKEKIQVVQLQQNDTVRITVPIDANESKTTFIVEETAANGNALNLDNFAYEISGEGKVEMSLQNTDGSITLTNIVKDDAAESSTEEEEDEPTTRKKLSLIHIYCFYRLFRFRQPNDTVFDSCLFVEHLF